ncbi:BaiN/RdsA family NAD(P)/FAD-dependent oxidoreductase [Hydrogenovibrio thermophilus]|nr:NAD(P)/FAD-dependent oxidoreductase [Hydrogenovibrio thermophilus]
MKSRTTDVLVLGAGAAGLMCAATAGYRGRRVEVLDHAPKAAAKIRISGGGKCNFTNLTVRPDHYLCGNPHFVKSALARYQPQDFIDLVDRHGLVYETRELGKLFCQNRAGDLIQILRTECDWAGVEFHLNTRVEQVEALDESHQPLRFRVVTNYEVIECESLVVATGGLSFPKLKASGFGYRLAEQFGLAVIEKRPGLVPLVFDGKLRDFCAAMAGVSLDVTIRNQDDTQSFSEALLFTHQGISGPGVLQISNYWRPGEAIRVNLLPDIDVVEALLKLKQENAGLKKWLNGFWPKKFTQAWLEKYPLSEPLAELPDERLRQYAEQLTAWTLYPSDTAGYDKAEVTLGGIDTNAISSKTLEVKTTPGLYFIGEVLDVTGQLGGYNFQWAWASGFAAGQSA